MRYAMMYWMGIKATFRATVGILTQRNSKLLGPDKTNEKDKNI